MSKLTHEIISTNSNHLADEDFDLQQMISSNQFGTFFGVSQKVLDTVWKNLTSPEGNSVTYISMEIGADLDVFHPVTNRLNQLKITEHPDKQLHSFIQSFLNGPVKIPNYGGGLGILAGDTLKSMADCKIPAIAVSLLYHKGYFSQLVDSKIGQVVWSSDWQPENTPGLYLLKNPKNPAEPILIDVPFYDKNNVKCSAVAKIWIKMEISENLEFFIPQVLLDYQTPDSPDWIKDASQHLYDSSSEKVKATQRRLLGAGVAPALKALGITSKTIHLNEQHGVAVVMALIADNLQAKYGADYERQCNDQDIIDAARAVSEKIVFTIHTPVKAGHDRFAIEIYKDLVSSFCERVLNLIARDEENPSFYNFTSLAMKINRTTNSVSRIHKEVTRKQFPQYADKITAITNGVHHLTWVSDAKAELFDTFTELANWREDPSVFAGAKVLLSNNKFRTYFQHAWAEDSKTLIDYVNRMLLTHRNQRLETWIDPPNYLSYLDGEQSTLNPNHFTLGFARRFSTYKRADLIFEDIDRLAAIITENNWPVNFIYAGKAHPSDDPGKELIKNILAIQEELFKKSNGLARLVFIPGYDMLIAKMMVAGSHAWLNSPKRPLEASGTSGMKAAMNGIPNLSIMDGWWEEGYHDGKTGWKFGYENPISTEYINEQPSSLLYEEDSSSFYQVFTEVLATFYDPIRHDQYLDKSIMNLIHNCPIFNTHRMVAEYVSRYNISLPKAVQEKINKFSKLYCSEQSD
ncbi:MAG: alpha-glucan family phosphorylase [Desulfobulbaceae bacterium]|nr:alpha-glucan family phosphorylase [Desulfobulbaceae bacterium]HIJ77865.1 alpha-glucan family phosphorylase [Deltaproteobacteria bacterium]